MNLLAKSPGMTSLHRASICVLYTVHIEIFSRDLISQLAIHNSTVCTWVTNVLVSKPLDTNVASADHSEAFIHHENMR